MIKSLFIAVFIMLSSLTMAQNTLTIEITNLRNDKGVVSLELFDEDNNSLGGKTASIKNKKCTIIYKELKKGKYAVRYFHDENNNKNVDKNRIGIPIEGYGFSNDAYGAFGPKKFEKMLFPVAGETKIKLRTNYFQN